MRCRQMASLWVFAVCSMLLAVAARAAPAPETEKSPTLAKKPPAGAVVLLAFEPGKAPSLEKWDNKAWEVSPDGYAVAGNGNLCTVDKLADMHLHVEFNIPPGEGGKRAKGGGNSGVYLMDRYEIQILDSYGQPATANGCGAVYRRIAPKVNASLPAGEWQTFDITFHAPRFDAAGKKVKAARVTVLHNGVKVHDDVEVVPTGQASNKPELPENPLRLQDHGCPVKFRNIWYTKPKD